MGINILILFMSCIYRAAPIQRVLLQYSVLSPFSVLTLAGLVLLVFLAGLIGDKIFFTLFFFFLSTYAVLSVPCMDEKRASEIHKHADNLCDHLSVVPLVEEGQ